MKREAENREMVGRYLRAVRGVMMEALEGRVMMSVTYTPISIEPTDGGNVTDNPRIDEAGDVALGGNDTDRHSTALLYSHGTAVNLGTITGQNSTQSVTAAVAISPHGSKIVGQTVYSDLTNHASVYNGAGFTDIGTDSPSYNVSVAAAVNDSGTIVGELINSTTGATHAFSTISNVPTDLGLVSTAGFDQSQAMGIDTAGVVVGTAIDTTTNTHHPFIDQNAVMTDIGVPTGFTDMFGRAINDSGVVVGEAYGNGTHAFTYSNGTFHDLGSIGGDGEALSINAQGDVVGDEVVGVQNHAFIYTNGTITDLNTLLPANSGWVLSVATGINDAGQIVGNGSFNGTTRAFLLNPSGSVVTPPAGGTLPPTLASSSVAANVVAGGKLKKAASFSVTVGNTSGAAVKAPVTVKILAVSGSTSEAIATTSKTLKIAVGGTSTPVKLTAKSLPADLASGTYTLKAETIDASGNVTTASTGPTVTVAAPFVSLAATVSGVAPATIKVGKAGAFTVTLTNSGNIDAAGTATITTGFALSSAVTPTLGTPASKTVKVVVGKPTKLKLKLPALTVAGTFVPFVSITEGGVTTTAFGATVFTVA